MADMPPHDDAEMVFRDMYGFARTKEYVAAEKKLNSAKVGINLQRDTEWCEYLKAIGGCENLKPAGVFRSSDDLKAMCRRGIPAAYRASVWQHISLSTANRSRYPAGYYQHLLRRAKDKLKKSVADDIDKDLDRTFPEHTYFDAEEGREGMRRVLTAFAVHNIDIGYCQSLNFIAGMMLLFMCEEDAFWLLVTVAEKVTAPLN
jgi:hypothetical protein